MRARLLIPIAAVLWVVAWTEGSMAARAHAGLQAPAGPRLRYDSSDVAVRTLPPAALEAYRDDPAFRYAQEAEAPETWWTRFTGWLREALLEPFWSPALAPVRRILFYGIVALVIGYAILRLLRMEASGVFVRRRPSTHVRFRDGDDPSDLDLDRLLREATAARDYRRAVRLSYLLVLRVLVAHGLIAWHAEKTNHDYLAELAATPLYEPFARLTTLFEYVWYGDFDVDAATYARVHDDFDGFIESVRAAHPAGRAEPATGHRSSTAAVGPETH